MKQENLEVTDEIPPKKSRKESPKRPITPSSDEEMKVKDIKQEPAEKPQSKDKEEKEKSRKEEEKKVKQEKDEKVKVKEETKGSGDSDDDFNDFAIGLDIACVVCKLVMMNIKDHFS